MSLLIKSYSLYFAWLVSLIATFGSLYFSEIADFIPCNLCWYQRILMYPLSILLGVAAFHEDREINRYAVPLAIIRGLISFYHVLEQKMPQLS